jgi:hypothetical protein
MEKDIIFRRYADRVGYRDAERKQIQEGDPRLRQIERLARAAARYAIAAEVVKARHCNSDYRVGDSSSWKWTAIYLPSCARRVCASI